MYDVMSGHLKIASNFELGLYLPPSNFNLVFSNKQAKKIYFTLNGFTIHLLILKLAFQQQGTIDILL